MAPRFGFDILKWHLQSFWQCGLFPTEAVTIPYPEDFGDVDAKDTQHVSLKEFSTQQRMQIDQSGASDILTQLTQPSAEDFIWPLATLDGSEAHSQDQLAQVVCVLRGRARQPEARPLKSFRHGKLRGMMTMMTMMTMMNDDCFEPFELLRFRKPLSLIQKDVAPHHGSRRLESDIL